MTLSVRRCILQGGRINKEEIIMLDLTFGEQVKIILSRKGMTIKELAETIEERTGKSPPDAPKNFEVDRRIEDSQAVLIVC